jgi:hypothetical protein
MWRFIEEWDSIYTSHTWLWLFGPMLMVGMIFSAVVSIKYYHAAEWCDEGVIWEGVIMAGFVLGIGMVNCAGLYRPFNTKTINILGVGVHVCAIMVCWGRDPVRFCDVEGLNRDPGYGKFIMEDLIKKREIFWVIIWNFTGVIGFRILFCVGWELIGWVINGKKEQANQLEVNGSSSNLEGGKGLMQTPDNSNMIPTP